MEMDILQFHTYHPLPSYVEVDRYPTQVSATDPYLHPEKE